MAIIFGKGILGCYCDGCCSSLYLTKLNEVLLTLLIYLAWLVAIIVFKNDLIFPKFIIQAILAGFMTGFSAMLGVYAKAHG